MSTFPGEVKQRIGDEEDGLGRERKTHCKKGHPYDGANTYWHRNWKGYQCRGCRACVREAMQRKREKPDFKIREAAKMRRWRAANPLRAKAAEKKAYQKRDQWIQSFKKQCKFCPEDRSPCLDFHHRDSGEKLGTIGQSRYWSRAKLLEEIQKCDVVCANCHRWLHWEENRQKQVLEGV